MNRKDQATINRVLLYREEIRSLLEDFIWDSDKNLNDKLRNEILEFNKRFKIQEIHIAGAILDPDTKNLNCIDNYLEAKKNW